MATAGTRFESAPAGPVTILAIPWQEPHAVEPEELQRYISMLERACEQRPQSADTRTCLGMAHAMNCDLHRSLGVLEEARRIEPQNFFAQLKFAELQFRLRALERADNETCRAAELAGNAGELSLARTQLAEIRCLRWEGSQRQGGQSTGLLRFLFAMLALLALAGILIVLK